MKEIPIVLRDEQQLQLNHMTQETRFSRDLLINSAINQYFLSYTAWKRRFSVEPNEGDKGNPSPDLAQALEQWR
jgi:putative salt-induced outer membrane protein YdiY